MLKIDFLLANPLEGDDLAWFTRSHLKEKNWGQKEDEKMCKSAARLQRTLVGSDKALMTSCNKIC